MKSRVRNVIGYGYHAHCKWLCRDWVRKTIKAKKARRWREHLELLAYQASFRRGPFGYGPLLMPDGELHATYTER